MKVLVVDEEIPFPLNSGKRIRTFNLLYPLAQRHDITFVCRRHETIESLGIDALKRVGIDAVVVPHPIQKKEGLKFYIALFANLFSKYPYSVDSHYSKALSEKVREIVDEKQIDLIHCEWTPYFINVRDMLNTPSIVVAHNIEAMIWKRNSDVEVNLLKKMFMYLQWKKMERFEKRVFQKFTRQIAVSDEDRCVIEEWASSRKVDVVPNGVDVDFFSRGSHKAKPFSLVFTGSMDWRPNVDGMLYFLDDIWPLVLRDAPTATLTIVGRRPMEVLINRVAKESSVFLTGTVEDVRPYMDEAMVYIVPLRVGGGSRLKILEAMAMGMPVVSTTIGAEGLHVKNGRDFILADNPHSFANTIGELFRDPQKVASLGRAGRILVEEEYQWKRLAERLEMSWKRSIA